MTTPFDQEAPTPTLPPPEGAPKDEVPSSEGEVWFPKSKSRGTYIRVHEIVGDKATIIRYDHNEEQPHLQTIRVDTLNDRYERELH